VRFVGREFATLSSLYEDDPDFDRDLGLIHLLSGDFNNAGKALETGLLLNPRQPSAGFLLALARLGQGRRDDARALLERVPQSDPSYAAAQQRLQQLRQ
jgi:tetratricopeptide (TPR) repeat protein